MWIARKQNEMYMEQCTHIEHVGGWLVQVICRLHDGTWGADGRNKMNAMNHHFAMSGSAHWLLFNFIYFTTLITDDFKLWLLIGILSIVCIPLVHHTFVVKFYNRLHRNYTAAPRIATQNAHIFTQCYLSILCRPFRSHTSYVSFYFILLLQFFTFYYVHDDDFSKQICSKRRKISSIVQRDYHKNAE